MPASLFLTMFIIWSDWLMPTQFVQIFCPIFLKMVLVKFLWFFLGNHHLIPGMEPEAEFQLIWQRLLFLLCLCKICREAHNAWRCNRQSHAVARLTCFPHNRRLRSPVVPHHRPWLKENLHWMKLPGNHGRRRPPSGASPREGWTSLSFVAEPAKAHYDGQCLSPPR